MAVKSERIDEKQDIEFPCLMASDYGSIVLFTSDKTGILVLVGPDNYTTQELGRHSTNWAMHIFTPYHGKVVLQNEG